MYYVVFLGKVYIIKIFFNYKVDVNVKDNCEFILLYFIVKINCVEVVKEFI